MRPSLNFQNWIEPSPFKPEPSFKPKINAFMASSLSSNQALINTTPSPLPTTYHWRQHSNLEAHSTLKWYSWQNIETNDNVLVVAFQMIKVWFHIICECVGDEFDADALKCLNIWKWGLKWPAIRRNLPKMGWVGGGWLAGGRNDRGLLAKISYHYSLSRRRVEQGAQKQNFLRTSVLKTED